MGLMGQNGQDGYIDNMYIIFKGNITLDRQLVTLQFDASKKQLFTRIANDFIEWRYYLLQVIRV